MNRIQKGVILAGGRGTRLKPQTEITNKHLLPIYTKHMGAVPMIWYPLNTLISSGVEEILIVSSQEHCGHFIEFLGDGSRFKVSLSYRVQDHNNPNIPLGIASALKLCEPFVCNENFAVILGDNFFEESFPEIFESFYKEPYGCYLFLKQHLYPERFGVAQIKENKIYSIIEKPQKYVSNFVVTGLYLFTPDVFEIAKTLKPSRRNELEITDINNYYASQGKAYFSILQGFWSDMGVVQSLLETTEWINNKKYVIFQGINVNEV
ncbi:MAG: sugar phosphate nucleotidyltransferase [Candidatus Dojkabacteria bacterium]|nr:sugar phosphate nucleotidyltransferase [Candidatus Dojkabacteria bacterium]